MQYMYAYRIRPDLTVAGTGIRISVQSPVLTQVESILPYRGTCLEQKNQGERRKDIKKGTMVHMLNAPAR